ncbi:MAG: aminodeoxychorismate lyase [Chromatiales bacterium]
MDTSLLINGKPMDQIAAADRGLQYGDGLFETIVVVQGKPLLWDRHMARLEAGERRLGLPPENKVRLLQEVLGVVVDKSPVVVKIILTRGAGGRGYRPPVYPQVSRIVSVHEWPRYPVHWFSSGIQLRICSTRLGHNSRLAGIKHLNRLEQVLARQEWDDPNIPEGLMLDEQGYVIEGTQSNLFLLKGRYLITPDLSACGVAGVVRELVLEVAKQLKLKIRIAAVSLGELQRAEVLFITNSLLGICPVVALESRRYDIDKIPRALVQKVRSLALGSVAVP